MNEILDEIETGRTQKIFSKLSIIVSLITWGLLFFLFWIGNKMMKPPQVIVYIILISSFSGVLMTVLSFIKKESSTWYKWIGCILNVLFFLLLIASVVFMVVMDYRHQ